MFVKYLRSYRYRNIKSCNRALEMAPGKLGVFITQGKHVDYVVVSPLYSRLNETSDNIGVV